ncbi:hypothetical protein SVAN01_02862 [Stagonosporopsis vannaccii]|nr:hypothetical protein SVAN01_02862 [Stagonosporopsis vannaccii]
MPSINFNATFLEPIPLAAPGRTPLRRRASAPELAKLDHICEQAAEAYEVGNTIQLQLMGRQVRAQITKTFTPFTMAQVMVVRVFEPLLDLEGDYVLKLFHRRHSPGLREPHSERDRWSAARDIEFEKRRWSKDFVKFFVHLMANEHLHYTGEDFDEDDEVGNDSESSIDDEKDSNAYDEMYFQVQCLKMYRAELEVYRKARRHGIDGDDVPRFISSVRVPPNYTSRYHKTECSSIKGIPGVLLQYLPGFPLKNLYCTSLRPPPLRKHWKLIIDDGLRIVQYFMQNMEIRNLDQSTTRNTVVHWDPVDQKWKCKLIDFGHCEFRPQGMSKWEWRRRQAALDEEAAVARHMQIWLGRNEGFQYLWERSQYSEDLLRDFRGEFSTGVQPDDYES